MMRALFTAATGMVAQQLNVDVVANNIANVNTVGFKRSRVDFQDLLYQMERLPGATVAGANQAPTGAQVGLGVRAGAIQKMFSQGEFQQTGNPLDLVIEGDGFFQILLPDGRTGYTRDGAYKRDSTGRVVTSDGCPVQPDIVVPADATDISVGSDGTVSVLVAGQAQPQQIGSVSLVRFVNPAGLAAVGRNGFVETAASGPPIAGVAGQQGLGTIGQGFLEISNVDIVEEMVALIIAQRAYEANSRGIQTADEMLGVANTLRR